MLANPAVFHATAFVAVRDAPIALVEASDIHCRFAATDLGGGSRLPPGGGVVDVYLCACR
ncbi:MAG: hypothetical protein ACO3NE_09150 [Alphaproteobacteria bacterium]